MYLINTTTYELEQYINPAPYAILSHTWHDGEEVLYKDFINDLDKARAKKGFQKIKYLCTQAIADDLKFAWIDTVCIDKTSSAELSEAINSMFAWYQEAEICYVYLDDVEDVFDIPDCRWITRGWTLQELLAPKNVRFYNRDWFCIGTKASLATDLARCTRIDSIALTDASTIPLHSAATRMSWAADRQTTRIEDIAYCMLGIFGVNMSLLYGERDKAFIRLQEQILRQHQDVTLLAFSRKGLDFDGRNLLAQSPHAFGQGEKIVALPAVDPIHCEVISQGLQLRLRLLRILSDGPPRKYVILGCRFEFELNHLITIPVIDWTASQDEKVQTYLVDNQSLSRIEHFVCKDLPCEDILLLYETKHIPEDIDLHRSRSICSLKASLLVAHGYYVLYAEPRRAINSWRPGLMISEIVSSNGIVFRKFAFVHEVHNEAFIIMVAVERLWGSIGPQTHKAWSSMKAKPLELDWKFWLTQQKMYDILEHPASNAWYYADSKREGEVIKIIDGVEWHRVDDTEQVTWHLAKSLMLHSRNCFDSVNVTISGWGMLSPHLTIEVRPGKVHLSNTIKRSAANSSHEIR